MLFAQAHTLGSRMVLSGGGGGDSTAPTITSSAALSLAEGSALAHTLTASESVTWTKVGGADEALFTLTGNSLALASKDYEAPVDSDLTNTYVVTVRATDAALNTTDQTITVTVTAATEEWETGSKLRWAPPAQSSPTAVTLPVGFFSQTYGDNEDVIITGHGAIRTDNSDVSITGGRHVRIMGGHFRGRLTVTGVTGSIFIEGIEMDFTTSATDKDALVLGGKTGFAPDVYIQNCLVYGVTGTSGGVHADIIQLGAEIGHLRMHKFTGDTNYQGFFLPAGPLIASATYSDVNLKINALGTPLAGATLLWFRNQEGEASSNPLYPVHFSRNVYIQANSANPGQPAIYPTPGADIEGDLTPGGYSPTLDGGGNATFPAGSGVTGTVFRGNAPSDYVLAANVGLSYVSPGYSATP